MFKNKKEWLLCLKNILFASLASGGVLVMGSLVLAAALTEIENQSIRNVTLFVMMMVIYAIFFYRFHLYPRLDTYAEHTDDFSPKKELLAFIHAEGKIIFAIYGIVAIVAEFSDLIIQNTPQNPILFSAVFCLSPLMAIPIPVVRSILALAYSVSLVCLLVFLRSRKIHREKISAKKR
ncbi:MAG: hypothetical protein IKM34_01380 [Clostridia bacterium]|nr:hypothetical protein [Clostridia bacterium]